MAVSVVSFSFSRAAQLEAQGPSFLLSAGFLYHILVPTGLVPKLHRGSRRPLRPGVAFPTTSCLRRLWSPTQSGSSRAPSAGLSLPHLISNFSGPQLSDFLSWPSYIIVQRPLNRPLNLWNDMFDRHQAVQRSLSSGASVYECIMGFTLSHFISQIRPRDLFRLLAIGMCHFLPAHHFGMACLAGSKVKIQHYFQIWNKKEHKISRVISSHMDRMYIESSYKSSTGLRNRLLRLYRPAFNHVAMQTPYYFHVYQYIYQNNCK